MNRLFGRRPTRVEAPADAAAERIAAEHAAVSADVQARLRSYAREDDPLAALLVDLRQPRRNGA